MDVLIYSMLAFATLLFVFIIVVTVMLVAVILKGLREYRSATTNERMLAAGIVMTLGALKAVLKK